MELRNTVLFSGGIGVVLIFAFIASLFTVEARDNPLIIESNSGGGNSTSTECINVGNGVILVKNSTNNNCYVKTLVGSNDISITNTSNTVIIDYNGSSSGGVTSVNAGNYITVNQTSGNVLVSFNGTFPLQTSTLLNSTVHTDTITQTPSKGSIIYGDNTPKWNELPFPNANGTFLRASAGQLSWSNFFSTQLSINVQLTEQHNFVVMDSSGAIRNVTLPDIDSDNRGMIVGIKKDNSNTNMVIIDGFGSETINGATTYNLTRANQYVVLISFADIGNRWFVYAEGNNMVAGSGITIVNGNTHIISTNFANGTGISITGSSQQTITNTRPELQIGKTGGHVYLSLVKTNIGTGYVDIYTTAFDEENMMTIDCSNVTRGRITYIWDYVGTGTQQLRWVDVSNNANVFYESPTFTTDRDATDSGTFVKPSWCNGIVTIEQQGKSTVGGDDPVAKGYMITLY